MSPAARQIVSNLNGVLVQAAHPKHIILFGSQARGDAAPHSNFDVMVVEEKPADRFAEMVRLNRLIRSFDVAIDLLVVSGFSIGGTLPATCITRPPPAGRSSMKRREQALLFLRKAAQDDQQRGYRLPLSAGRGEDVEGVAVRFFHILPQNA